MARAASIRRESASPQPLGTALEAMFRKLGIGRKVLQYSVVTEWPSIVGEKIAGVTNARRVEHGTLFVDVSSAAWRNELVMRKGEILEKIRERIGKKVVQDIRFY